MSRRVAWAGIAIVGIALEAESLQRHDGATLSETLRAVYHTSTPTGRALFVASWAALTIWFVPHICRAAVGAASAAVEAFDAARPEIEEIP
jgi:hypothetical protein